MIGVSLKKKKKKGKPNGQTPFENAAQPELHQPTSRLKPSLSTSQQDPFKITP